jgi:serine/threonine protein kinase
MRQAAPSPAQDGIREVLWQDGDRVLSRVWRSDADGGPEVVLTVTFATDYPTPASADRLAHEFGLRDELNAAWAVRPLEHRRHGGRNVLVLEDPGGEPVDRILGKPLEIAAFLRLAIATTTALAQIHRHGLIHKDIKPSHIFVNKATGQVKLTGFGVASRLPRERQAPDPPEVIAGTLAYMAPEQTGRMNRSIDGRSDLYALGVSFYQMLTGSLPFVADDPMDWVHCHIARKPVPPASESRTFRQPFLRSSRSYSRRQPRNATRRRLASSATCDAAWPIGKSVPQSMIFRSVSRTRLTDCWFPRNCSGELARSKSCSSPLIASSKTGPLNCC